MEQVSKSGCLAQLKECFILMSTGLSESGVLTHLGYPSPPFLSFVFIKFQDPSTLAWASLMLRFGASLPNQVKRDDTSQTTKNELTLSSITHPVPFSTHSIPMVILAQGPLKSVEGQPGSGLSFDHRNAR